MRVLVAEPDAGTRRAIAVTLWAAGMTVTEADLGEDVLFVAGDEPVDAIVAAGDLPDMTAPQLARALRSAGIGAPLLVCDADGRVSA